MYITFVSYIKSSHGFPQFGIGFPKELITIKVYLEVRYYVTIVTKRANITSFNCYVL